MNIIKDRSNKKSNLDWWNSLMVELNHYADHKWLACADYLITHHCATDNGTKITQSLIAQVSGVDPAELSKKLKEYREGQL